MGMFSVIYKNLCERGRNKSNTEKDVHRHHIIPKHSGGKDDDCNITHLTIREHKIAHYLLWKINNSPNDLRAFHMLGGNLTSSMRKHIGDWCYENMIGMFHPQYTRNRKEWTMLGVSKQMKEKVGIFDPNKFSYHASLGGKASVKTNTAFQYWFSAEGLSERASRGGKSHTGKRAMYDPNSNTDSFKRVPPEKWNEFLNMGFVFGSPIKPNLGKKTVSKRKRKVTDGTQIYDSVSAAAKANNVTNSAIIHRIKVGYDSWRYFSDI